VNEGAAPERCPLVALSSAPAGGEDARRARSAASARPRRPMSCHLPRTRRRGALGSAARLPVYCRVAAGERSRPRASPGRSAGRGRIT